MKTCASCGKSIEHDKMLHGPCLKKLFGIDYLPAIGFSLPELSITAQSMVGKLSISGVQPKLSMKLNRKAGMLEVVAEGGEYILKPQVQTYPALPENENLCMTIAAHLGIEVPPHALLRLQDGTCAYIVKRFDRKKEEKIHQEDFLQILGGRDKYQGSYESIGKKLFAISDVPGLDVQLFYERVLLNFIVGNGDAHMKNFSIQYGPQGQIRLTPAYDIVPSKLVIPDEEDCALTLLGKKNKLTGGDFYRFAEHLGIPRKAIENKFVDKQEVITGCIDAYPCFPEKTKQVFKSIIADRFQRLTLSDSR